MGRLRGRAALAAALALAGCALVGAGVRVVHAAGSDAATRTLEYLEGQQSATDGSIAGGYSANALYAIGAAAGGYDPHLLEHGGPSVMDYLTGNAAAACPGQPPGLRRAQPDHPPRRVLRSRHRQVRHWRRVRRGALHPGVGRRRP